MSPKPTFVLHPETVKKVLETSNQFNVPPNQALNYMVNNFHTMLKDGTITRITDFAPIPAGFDVRWPN